MLYHKRESDPFRTSIACLLELDMYDVPDFADINGGSDPEVFDHAIRQWLLYHDLRLVKIICNLSLEDVLKDMEKYNPGVEYILAGKGKNDFVNCVCCKGGQIAHDVNLNNISVVAPDSRNYYTLLFFSPIITK